MIVSILWTNVDENENRTNKKLKYFSNHRINKGNNYRIFVENQLNLENEG